MKSFAIISVLTAFCFGVAGVSSRFVKEESVEKAINKKVFSDHKYVKKEKVLKIEDARVLDIESFSEDIIISEDESLTDSIKINYYEIYDLKTDELLYPKFTSVNVNRSLNLSFEPAKKNYSSGQIAINLDFPFFSITDSSKKRREMQIKVPKNSNLKDLNLESLSGDIVLEKLNLEVVDLEIMSGDITAESNKINELNVSSKSGDLNFKDSEFEVLKISSTSGDINFENSEVKNLVSLKSTAGDIDFAGEFKEGEFKSTAGDIDIKTKNPKPELKISATAGDIDLEFLSKPNIQLITSTFAGDIEVDGKDIDKKSNPVTLGNGDGRVKIATTAGDISIQTEQE